MITFVIFENKPALFESVNTNKDWEKIYNTQRYLH